MSTLWKVVIALVLVLPMTAYVVGSLVAAADEPSQPRPIIVQESPNPGDSRTTPPGKVDEDERPDPDGKDDDGRKEDDAEDDGPIVVTPEPDDLDDSDDDEGRDVDDRDGADDDGDDHDTGDDSGHGGGDG